MLNLNLTIKLSTSAQQAETLCALQKQFAQVCTEIAAVATRNRCWHRVTLHHLVYREMRGKFPQMGSQMICNAIYSVCRTCRQIFQGRDSQHHISSLEGKSLPSLQFLEVAPVYFDKHTLSIKEKTISMFTMEGRVHFDIPLQQDHRSLFSDRKLLEIVLYQEDGSFVLVFTFATNKTKQVSKEQHGEMPEYILLSDEPLTQPKPNLHYSAEMPDTTQGSQAQTSLQ